MSLGKLMVTPPSPPPPISSGATRTALNDAFLNVSPDVWVGLEEDAEEEEEEEEEEEDERVAVFAETIDDAFVKERSVH